MRNKLIVGIALVLGILAAFLVYNYLSNISKAAQNRIYTDVVTAATDIPANTAITPEMLQMKPFPTELKTGKELTDISAVVGRISPLAIGKGEVLLDNRLVQPGSNTERLSYTVPVGMRAMSIPVNEVTGVANMVRKGDHVDIVAMVSTPEPRATLILQDIEILAVGTVLNDSSTPNPEKNAVPATVTLAVDPQSAVKLKLALQTTNIALTLRSASDKNLVNPAPVTANQL